MKRLVVALAVFVSMALLILTAAPALANLDPPTLERTLQSPDEYEIALTKTVIGAPTLPNKADVVFAFDLSGTMGPILDTAKEKAETIISRLSQETGVEIAYGVISFMDYPFDYTGTQNCGYEDGLPYGYPELTEDGFTLCSGDYPYRLDQPVTTATPSVVSAINGLILGCGGDMPESHTRVFHESYADPSVGWRPDAAKKILISFSDAYPHDCNLNQDILPGVWSTGHDPGPDNLIGTADDLVLLQELDSMKNAGITLLACQVNNAYHDHWEAWANHTGGTAYNITGPTFEDTVVAAIKTGLSGLHLEVTFDPQSCSSWVKFEPISADQFREIITVPLDTPPGTYSFTVEAHDENGNSYGSQSVALTIPAPEVTGRITGMKYHDLNGDGLRTPGEPGLKDWTIRLYGSAGNLVASTATGADGRYAFTNLEDGAYTVTEVQKSGWTQTAPASGSHIVQIIGGSTIENADFGNQRQGGPHPAIPGMGLWGTLAMMSILGGAAVMLIRRKSAAAR